MILEFTVTPAGNYWEKKTLKVPFFYFWFCLLKDLLEFSIFKKSTFSSNLLRSYLFFPSELYSRPALYRTVVCPT